MIAAFVAIVDSIDILTVLHDAARYGTRIATWEPIVWEYSSGVGILAACWIVYRALRIAPPGWTAWPRSILVHGIASLGFSITHVTLMTILRVLIYASLRLRYAVAPADFPYEYRKDLLAYVVLGGVFWLVARPGRADHEQAIPTPSADAPETFDIVDGPATLRVPVTEIHAIRAAANYVEFHLEGGRRRLMRASLGEMEERLEPAGFVRTHRSWIVNPRRIRTITPNGSGGYRIGLDGGDIVPLSRRYRGAMRTDPPRDGEVAGACV